MAKNKRKDKEQNPFGLFLDFVDTADAIFAKLTGRTIAAWLKEFQQPSKELPEGKQAATQQPAMPLADAYAILGLPPTATLKEVKRNYRRLAAVFHPDAPGGYKEAMVLLNNAHDRIMKAKGE